MTFKIKFSTEAEADLDSAFAWIAKDAPGRARLWLDLVVQSINLLTNHPDRCPIAPESSVFGTTIRHLILGNYRVLYNVEQKARIVNILYIRHASRDVMQADEDDI